MPAFTVYTANLSASNVELLAREQGYVGVLNITSVSGITEFGPPDAPGAPWIIVFVLLLVVILLLLKKRR